MQSKNDRNREIIKLRVECHMTYEQIGNFFSISRERVRQILNDNNITTDHGGYGKLDFCQTIGVSIYTVDRMITEGKLDPVRIGKKLVFSDDDVKIAETLKPKKCIRCGRPLERPKGFSTLYCDACREERKRYNYPFLSREAKRNRGLVMKRWMEKHPEKARAIRQRTNANRKKRDVAGAKQNQA